MVGTNDQNGLHSEFDTLAKKERFTKMSMKQLFRTENI